MSHLDLNQAEAQSELIPEGTVCRVILHVQAGDHGAERVLQKSKNSESLMLTLEATVTEGKYAKRKFWPRYFMGVASGALTEGQDTAVGISMRAIRAIVEAHKGFSPTDETPAAIEARKLKGFMDLNGMECWVVVGVEKGRDGYDDKNVIKRVIPAGREPTLTAADEARAHSAATQQSAASTKSKWG